MSSITIKDVAVLAGVSIKTVSRVLNGEPHVKSGTRESVLSAVKMLNYRPNFAARALAGSRAYLVALYFDNPSPDYVSGLQFGAMESCRQAGFHLLVEQVDSSRADAHGHIDVLLSTVKTDGVILSPPVCDRADIIETLEAQGVPFVRIAPAGDLERGPYVYMDDRQAAFEMTCHLQALGHRHIAFVKGHAKHSAAALRFQGFLEAMEDAGLAVDRGLVENGNFSFRSGVGAAERLLNRADRPTAIFASNDDMALGVMAVANRMQLNVPDQLSVAGFDDSPIAQVVWPQLTTIRQPVTQMAAKAASILIHPPGPDEATAHLLPFQLIVRQSTGPVP